MNPHLELDNRILRLTTKNDLILDLGCGQGSDIEYLAKNGRIMVGLDYSTSQIKKAKNNLIESNIENVHLVRGDIRFLPFKPKSFDFIYSVLVMQYFKNINQLIKEQKRILKDKKFIGVYVTYRYSMYTLAKHIMIYLNKSKWKWETEFSMREICRYLKVNGFDVIDSWSGGLDIYLNLIVTPEYSRIGKILNFTGIQNLKFIIWKILGITRYYFPNAAITSIVAIGRSK